MGKFSDRLLRAAKSYRDTEWTGKFSEDDTDDVTLLARPLTPADMTLIARDHPDFTRSPSMEGMVDLLILKARDDAGQKAFDKGDKPILMKIETNKIGEIFSALFGKQLVEDDEDAFEERVKN